MLICHFSVWQCPSIDSGNHDYHLVSSYIDLYFTQSVSVGPLNKHR